MAAAGQDDPADQRPDQPSAPRRVLLDDRALSARAFGT
jgi:hypothetical protein